MSDMTGEELPSRYLIGIDLGTTNSAAAYVDTTEREWVVRDFPIPQLVGAGEIETRETLPSFHYEAAKEEFAPGAMQMAWDREEKNYAVGIFAREHGAVVPGRLVVSAKSWLSHSGVDRTAGLLPWHGAADVERLSPVEVSARYLNHIRAAWDQEHPEHKLADQDVVLTVPASFDEVARELTIEAARRAGLVHVVLVEEPQAAFYAWIHARGTDWESQVQAEQKILVCDIGGGTSDFTLIRVRPAEGEKVLFHRIAVGEHLILGGDNLDLALAHHIEARLTNQGQLDSRQFSSLVRTCRQVKENLLGPNPPERMVVNLAGSGSRLIGSALQIEITRDEVEQWLVEGFLPRVKLEEKPVARRSGFQEFGLPYAPDAAMTRYLAAFLSAHAASDAGKEEQEGEHPERPDLVLFNGGFFESPVLRGRLLEVLASWFGDAPCPRVLENDRLDLAVARGAAYYGMVRRGRGVRISGGLAHSYYISVQSEQESVALCLLPAGVEEGHTVDLPERQFNLLIRQPVEFPLYVSSTRTTDPPGTLLPIDLEQMSPLPPIRTVLQSGKKAAAESVSVTLHARLTEIGTLELWCSETRGDRQWRLQFDVRAATRADIAKHEATGEAEGVIDEQILVQCGNLIREAFRLPTTLANRPEGLVKRLESESGLSRHEWPSSLMRRFWETLMEMESGRHLSVDHEARWLNLTGFCLRPGYGLAVDDWRVGQLWRLFAGKVVHLKNELCRAEWWILWRRIAGGLSAGQQQTMAEPLLADWRTYIRKGGVGVKGRGAFQFGPHESAEVWRLLGSLELLKPVTKTELGNIVLELLARPCAGAIREAQLFALGRLGACLPVYGPLNALLSVETIEEWAQRLINLNLSDEKASFALMQMTRRTGDRYRDISETLRNNVLDWLKIHGAPSHYQELVREGGHLRDEEQRIVFGESLPRGLRIE